MRQWLATNHGRLVDGVTSFGFEVWDVTGCGFEVCEMSRVGSVAILVGRFHRAMPAIRDKKSNIEAEKEDIQDVLYFYQIILVYSFKHLTFHLTVCCLEETMDSLKSGIDCGCTIPCTQTEFATTVSQLKWLPYLDDYKDDIDRYGMTRVRVFYESLEAQIVDIFSNIGGQIGLWLGISLVALYEASEKIEVSEETIANVENHYEKELGALKRSLEETLKAKAASYLEASRYDDELSEFQLKYNKKEKDLSICEKSLVNSETQVNDLQSRLNHAISDLKKTGNEAKELKTDRDRLAEELKKLKKELESLTMERASLCDENQDLKDTLKFKENLFQEKIKETRTNRTLMESEIEAKLKSKLEYDLSESINELRVQFLSEVDKAKADYESKNHAELNNAMKRVNDYSKQAQGAREDLSSSHIRIENLLLRVTNLENENATSEAKLKDCEEKMVIERRINARRLSEKDDQVSELRNELERQLQEYHDLMDIKLTLDFEIATYRKLLESEENRLNMSSDTSQLGQTNTPVRRAPLRGKRKRTLLSQEKNIDTEEKLFDEGEKADGGDQRCSIM
ncbi:Prelamin-A/C [Nymphon striatum]|nr:Prelamin-A/C [Nymphon striatum]